MIPEYVKVIKLIKQVNPLMKLISLANGLTTIPFAAWVIVIIITYAENDQFVIKYCYLVPAAVLSIRGVVMTFVLAHIDRKCFTSYWHLVLPVDKSLDLFLLNSLCSSWMV